MIRLFRRYLSRYWLLLLGVVVAQVVATIASLNLPNLNARIIDQGVAKGDRDRILFLGGIMLAITAAQVVGQIVAVYLGGKTAMSFGRDVRQVVFDKVLSFSSRELNKFGAPSLITRNTNDVQQVQLLVFMICFMMISAPIMAVGGIIMAYREDPGLSWLVFVAVAVLAVSITLLAVQVGPLFQRMQKQIDALNRVVREQITGIRVVRAFVREDFQAARFDQANHDVSASALAVGRIMATLFPVVFFVMNISTVGVLWFGGHRVDTGNINIGQLMAFLQYLMQILMSIMMTTMMIIMIPRAVVCAGRINEVLDTKSTVVWQPNARTDLDGHGLVSLRNVEFSYPGAEHPVLKGISFDIHPGEITAIIGSTGAGKTTLVNLIPRLYDTTAGMIEIDGVNVREADPDTLWSRVGLVPQRPYLFSGTIASNLRYGNPEATDDELWRALEIAQAKDFVAAMPDGLDTALAQGGTSVSGGQRQRLAIARALVKKADIYVFDDSFSALDVATDARLRAALATETADAAVLIVAQRVSTITSADQILVLEDGEIVGRGTHEELLAGNETYREIVESQLSAQEAA